MKIIAFNGSPRAQEGNTHVMVEEFLSGAKEAGAQVENIFLAKKNIKPCLGCFCCWVKTPGECVIKDDMKELLVKYRQPDIVVYATPLYVDNLTGIMKNFMDRQVPLADPRFEKDPSGEWRHVERVKEKSKLVVISNCGYPEQSQFQVLKLLFKRVARNEHTELSGEIYRGQGPLLTMNLESLEPVISAYKKLLRKAGAEVVTEGKISKSTALKLEEPIMPYDDYVIALNQHWDEVLGA